MVATSLAPYVNGRVDRIPNILPLQTGNRIMAQALQAVRTDERVNYLSRWLVRHAADEKEPGLEFDPAKAEAVAKLAEIGAIYHWVQKQIRYTFDPESVELTYHPSYLLAKDGPISDWQRWAEDCDTIASLTTTYLFSLGHQCRVTLAGFSNEPGYSHVFAESYLPMLGWIIVDPALSSGKGRLMAEQIVRWHHVYPEDIELDEPSVVEELHVN